MSIKNVTLLGADGTLGPAILHALLEHSFNVTALKRQSSKSPQSHKNEVRVPDDFPIDALVDVFRGQDAVIVTIKANQIELQNRIATASAQAGVKRFIPADFGSVDSSSALTQELVPLYKSKTVVREHLIALATEHPAFTWTSLVCGHFFDWSPAFLHLWPRERRADVLDDGTVRWSASTLGRVGEATARILAVASSSASSSHEGGGVGAKDPTVNRIVYVQSFSVTQEEVLRAFERATGAGEWEVTRFRTEEYRDERKGKADAGDRQAVEDLVWLLGAIDADWTVKENFAMKELGLEDESLEEVVAKMVKENPEC